jgi:carbon storage regulator
MLVLRRKAGEAIVLNGAITIYVLAVEGERVKLGISAPPEVVIVRSELLDSPMMGSGPSASSASGPLGGPSLPPGGSGSYTRPPMPRGPGASGSSWRSPDTSGWRQPEPPLHTSRPPLPAQPRRDDDDSGAGYGATSRYTPRNRYDTHDYYGAGQGTPSQGGYDDQPPAEDDQTSPRRH